NKPALTAEDVSKHFASHVREGAYGAPPAQDVVGFDEMLPDLPGRTVLSHERADVTEPSNDKPRWIAPYFARTTTARPELVALLDRAHQGERLDTAEVANLFRAEGADLEAVFARADQIRREVIGDDVTYVGNRNITYTNFCHTGCGFCGFARPIGH